MTVREMFQLIVIPFGLIFQMASSAAFYSGYGAPWVARNAARFTTLVWAIMTVLDGTDSRVIAGLDAIVMLLGVIRWNRPKDDEGPPRRRRKKKVEEKRSSVDWTGATVPT